MKKVLVFLLFVLPSITLFIGCDAIDDITDAVDKAVEAIDNAIYTLDQNSAEFQNVLQSLIADLENIDEELTIIVRGEISSLLERAPAVIGSEFRCNFDFVGDRINGKLRCILNRFMAENNYMGSIIPPECGAVKPSVCSVVPSSIKTDIMPKVIDLYGYDFDSAAISAALIDNNGSKQDVSYSLASPTHYHLTINLGNNGARITASSDKLELSYDNISLSSISVVYVEKCRIYNPGIFTYIPPVVENYCNPNGSIGTGPSAVTCKALLTGPFPSANCYVRTSVKTSSDKTRLIGTIYADFLSETSSPVDFMLHNSGKKNYTFFSSPAGEIITRYSFTARDEIRFIDNDDLVNYLDRGNGGLVKQYAFDVKGKPKTDAKVTATFNNLEICTGIE